MLDSVHDMAAQNIFCLNLFVSSEIDLKAALSLHHD